METPKVTVYTVSHNYGKYLAEAIESVLRQSIGNWELLLFDNNSTDDTRAIMELYAGDPRIRIFALDDGYTGNGISAIANTALREARGEYLIRLDADDVFDDNILLVLSHHLDQHAETALVFPDYYLMDNFGNVFAHERRQSLFRRNYLFDMPPNGACTMIRKTVMDEVGGYREDLNAQDGFDIWSRIKDNHRCDNVNIPLFYYRRHGDNMTENSTRILSARRQIKRDISAINLKKYEPVVAVIPCRRHYDIYPDLWNCYVNGKTLLDVAITKCMASSLIDKIVVTCDNPAVQDVFAKYNDDRLMYVERSTESTIRSHPLSHTLETVVRSAVKGWNGLSVLCYLQAPFTTTDTIEEAVYTLIMNNADSSIAVAEIQDALYRRAAHGLVPLNNFGHFVSDFDTVYSEVRTCMATRNRNLKTGSLTGAKIVNFIVPREEAFFIHTKRDFEIARLIVQSEEREVAV
jgi:glycosyltransferase involved in cell wall biosynthesis